MVTSRFKNNPSLLFPLAVLVVLVAVVFVYKGWAGQPPRSHLPPAFNASAAQSGTSSGSNSLTPTESASGWTSLFDGRTLSGWETVGPEQWKVEDGTTAVTAGASSPSGTPSGSSLLKTVREYAYYELKVDFWIDKTANSGIFIRCSTSVKTISTKNCYEVNIFDPHETYPTGSITNLHSTLPAFRADTAGKWNSYDITADVSHLIVKLNGMTTTDIQDDKFPSGSVALQSLGVGLIRFRNVKIRQIAGARSSQN